MWLLALAWPILVQPTLPRVEYVLSDRASWAHAVAARHAAATMKDDQAEAEMRVAVQEEAKKQAETVDTVTQDVMRAKGVSLVSADRPHEDKKLVCARPTTSAAISAQSTKTYCFPHSSC